MRTFYFYSVCLLALFFLNANSVRADVLGPYKMDNSVPSTPAGYDRIVLPLTDAITSVTASVIVCDESGKQYTLRAGDPQGAPNCYFMAVGTYRIVSFENCEVISSNWSNLTVGSTFYVNGHSGGYITLKYTGVQPDVDSIIQALEVEQRPANRPLYAIMKVYGEGANGSGTLVDSKGKEYSIYNYTGYVGGSHYFYILPGTYTVKQIGTNGNYIYLDISGTKSRLSDGDTFSVSGMNTDISIIFSKNAL